MSWFTQFFGLDKKPQPQQRQQQPQYVYQQYTPPPDTVTPLLMAQLKQMQEASKKRSEEAAAQQAQRAEAEKKAQDQAAFQSSVQSAHQTVAQNAPTAQGQQASMDEQRKATDAALASAQAKTASGSGFSPDSAKQYQYANLGAAPSAGYTGAEPPKKVAPGAVATSEQQNKTGAKASSFALPNTEGLTFGGV
jgi:hypothetical protein